jgi:hypothetical protein
MVAKRLFCVVACGVLFAVPAFSSDLKGSVMLDGGFILGQLQPNLAGIDNSVLMGGRIHADYFPSQKMSIGLETGYSTAQVGNTDFSVGVVPILARLAWHPFTLNKLDVYFVGKAGYGFGFWTQDGSDYAWQDPCAGFVWGADIGVRFFITQSFGIFLEAGYECQGFDWEHPGMTVSKWDEAADGRSYVHVGITIGFGRK